MDNDFQEPVYEDKFDDLNFQMLLREIPEVRDKFILIMIKFGYKKNEIAYILKVNPSTISREYSEALLTVASKRMCFTKMDKIDTYIMSNKKDVEDLCLDDNCTIKRPHSCKKHTKIK